MNWDMAQTLVAAAGLGMIVWELKQNRDALNATRDGNEAEYRAWIVIPENPVGQIVGDEGRFIVRLHNIGKVPARFAIDGRISGAFTSTMPVSDQQEEALDSSELFSIAPGEIVERLITADIEEKRQPPPRLYVRVLYVDALTNETRRTECMFWMGSKAGPEGINSLDYDVMGRATAQTRKDGQVLS